MLETWNKILNIHIRTINDLVVRLDAVCRAYEKFKKEISDIGFNVFKLSSDLYYRENFHSDIIKAFLDPYGMHKQTNLYLNLFVEMLSLNTADFEFSTVLREQNNIDILIVNKNSRKAIIIENKINNAGDRVRQLPRYLEVVSKEYEVAAIVYIPLDISKHPDQSGWDEDDKKEVDRLLHIIPAYCNNGNVNLVDHWITPSMLKSNDIDCMFILRQYGRLIKHLNTSIMDTVSLEKFYNSLQENNNLQTAISIRNMLNDLPTFLAIRIEEKFNNSYYPFTKLWRYKDRDTVFEGFKINDLSFKMDIWCNETRYDLYLWRPEDESFDIAAYFKEIELLNDFKVYNGQINNIVKHYDVFDEEALFDFITSLLKTLSNFRASRT